MTFMSIKYVMSNSFFFYYYIIIIVKNLYIKFYNRLALNIVHNNNKKEHYLKNVIIDRRSVRKIS